MNSVIPCVNLYAASLHVQLIGHLIHVERKEGVDDSRFGVRNAQEAEARQLLQSAVCDNGHLLVR